MYQVIAFTDDFKIRVLSTHETEEQADDACEIRSQLYPHAYVDVIEVAHHE